MFWKSSDCKVVYVWLMWVLTCIAKGINLSSSGVPQCGDADPVQGTGGSWAHPKIAGGQGTLLYFVIIY
jgi:hypothetical protein